MFLTRERFESEQLNFDEHKTHEHNIMYYFLFFKYIIERDEEQLSGTERQLKDRMFGHMSHARSTMFPVHMTMALQEKTSTVASIDTVQQELIDFTRQVTESTEVSQKDMQKLAEQMHDLQSAVKKMAIVVEPTRTAAVARRRSIDLSPAMASISASNASVPKRNARRSSFAGIADD